MSANGKEGPQQWLRVKRNPHHEERELIISGERQTMSDYIKEMRDPLRDPILRREIAKMFSDMLNNTPINNDDVLPNVPGARGYRATRLVGAGDINEIDREELTKAGVTIEEVHQLMDDLEETSLTELTEAERTHIEFEFYQVNGMTALMARKLQDPVTLLQLESRRTGQV
jgi:hypothetical protein